MQTIHPHVIKPWTNTLISEWYQFAIIHPKARVSRNLHKNILIRIRWHRRSSKTISLANQSMAGPCTGYLGYKCHALGRKVFPAPPYFRRADMCTTLTRIGVLALLFFSSVQFLIVLYQATQLKPPEASEQAAKKVGWEVIFFKTQARRVQGM